MIGISFDFNCNQFILKGAPLEKSNPDLRYFSTFGNNLV